MQERGLLMNVRECYEMMRGDYEDVRRRFLTDARIRRFALLFLDDRSMEDLRGADLLNRSRLFHTGQLAQTVDISEIVSRG